MIILLTNDDGVDSEGIFALSNALSANHEVWRVAPDVERSGTSHAITLKDAVRFSQINDQVFSCGGTPADCVLFSLLGAIPAEPTLVVSGINHGANLGTDIVYSGTVAAARQAALMNVPAIAVSLVTGNTPASFSYAAQFMAENIELLKGLWSRDHFINVNVPVVEQSKRRSRRMEIAITHPTRRIYRDHIEGFAAPNGDHYYFLQGSEIESGLEEGSDWAAVSRGDISVSAVHLHPLKHDDDSAYQDASFQEPEL